MSVIAIADPSVLLRRAREMIDSGRLLAARPLVAAFSRAVPDSAETVELKARLLVREGRIADALECLEAGRAQFGGGTLTLLLAELRLQSGDPIGATRDAADAVVADPTNVTAKALLGLALGRTGRFAEGQACLEEAVRAHPPQPAFHQALAEVLERSGNPKAAADALADALARWPANASLRLAAIMTAMRAREFGRVVELCGLARRDGAADACVFGLLGHALSSLGRHVEAGEAYEEARKLAPEDSYVRHLAASSGVVPAEGRASAAYVETVFDGYAEGFEKHLIDLGYRVPGLLRAALLARRGDADLGDVLDLGCGTGFIGVVLSDLRFRSLVGIDLSARMLAHAKSKNIYTELRQADILTALADEAQTWDVIIAGDSLGYFGDLREMFQLIRDRLRPGGLCLVSLEELGPTSIQGGHNWSLLPQGRYAHGEDYVRSTCGAVGLHVLAMGHEILRREGGLAVDGLIAVLERTVP